VGFGGQFGYYTDDTGRTLLGHRFYDADMGRFVTRDPIGYKGGINLYGFAGNNPVNESDPSGDAPELPKNEESGKLTLNSEDVQSAEDDIAEALERRAEAERGSTGRAIELEGPLRRNGSSRKTLESFFASLRRSQFWQGRTDFSGKRVYQRNDLIDPARRDATGRTSLQRMEDQGQPPIGPDGKPVVLHHLTQDDEGPMAEMEQTFHDNYRRVIHINTNTKGSNINRSAFRAWSKRYWRMRAGDFR